MRSTNYNVIYHTVLSGCRPCHENAACLRQYNIDRIIRLQKYAAKEILDIKYPQQVPSINLFEKLQMTTLPQRIDFFTSILMHKRVNSISPKYLIDQFVYTRDIHSVNSRHAVDGKWRLPKLSTTTGQRSFRYRGVKT